MEEFIDQLKCLALPGFKKNPRVRFLTRRFTWRSWTQPLLPGERSFWISVKDKQTGKIVEHEYNLSTEGNWNETTGQREFVFIEGIPDPINFNAMMPEISNRLKDVELLRTAIAIIKAKEAIKYNEFNEPPKKPMPFIWIIVGILVLVLIAMAWQQLIPIIGPIFGMK